MCIFVYECSSIKLNVYVCMYVNIYIYIHICMYIYLCMCTAIILLFICSQSIPTTIPRAVVSNALDSRYKPQ